MARQNIGIGTVADDGTGDTARVAGDKINDNFIEVYADIADIVADIAGLSYNDLSDLPSLGTVSSLDTGTTSGTVPTLSTGGKFDIARIPTGTSSSTVSLGDHTHAGRDFAADGTKLDGIETGATADQSEDEIKAFARTSVYNNSGGTLTIQFVSRAGYNSGTSEATIEAADAANSKPVLGALFASINNAASGRVVSEGPAGGFNTSTFSAGDPVYIADGGGITNAIDAGSAYGKKVGTVLVSDASAGVIWVDIAAPEKMIDTGDSVPDLNGNELLEFSPTASAVNHVKITNAATGDYALVEAAGGDTNTGLVLAGKGTGQLVLKYGSPAALTSSSNSVAWDAEFSSFFDLADLAENTTLANPTNLEIGQEFAIRIEQDAGGGNTMAYGSHFFFPGGPPVLSTAGDAVDLLVGKRFSSTVILANLLKEFSDS